MTKFSQIGALPAPKATPPVLPAGTVILYKDDRFSSHSMTLRTADYREGERHSFSGTSMQDEATYIAFNLPVGTVMTMTEHLQALNGHPVFDLRGCGKVIDLVGTGETVAIDLTKMGMNDCLSGFFWRRIDLQIGAIEIFEHANFGGCRTVLFLDDWAYSTLTPLNGWFVDDRASSARWASLDSTVAASLFNDVDGGKNAFNNIIGWGGSKQLQNFKDVGFNDCLSSFRWEGLIPMREEIDTLSLPVNVTAGNTQVLTADFSGTNLSSEPSAAEIVLENSESQEVTVTSSDSFTTGTEVTATIGFTRGNELTGQVSGSLSVAVSYSRTHTSETSNSVTKSVALSVTQHPVIPPMSSYVATMTVMIGRMPPTLCSTRAVRWYDQPVEGGVPDPEHNDWYRREEVVTLTISGGLASAVNVDVEATPLVSA